MAARTKCSDCNSSDGLATYEDGTYCHACQKLTKTRSLGEELIVGLKQAKSSQLTMPVPTPTYWHESCDYGKFPIEAAVYLKKYYITQEIIDRTGIFWSELYKRVCFPLYEKDEMVACWMRDVLEESLTKWLYTGRDKNTVCWNMYVERIGWESEGEEYYLNTTVCLVEDVISAIRVSKFLDCICLGSTSINEETRKVLLHYDKVVLFLDGDEAGKRGAQKIRNELKLTHTCYIVRNRHDPKTYDDKELEGLIRDSRNQST